MRLRIFVLFLASLASFAAAASDVERNPQPEQASAADDELESIAPDSRRELLLKFQGANARIREHVLNMPMNAYAESVSSPGLRLNRMWVGESGTLVEIEGLPVTGRQASAVIRRDTFVLMYAKGQAAVQAVEGVTQLKDRRGGIALAVQPGDRMLVLFDAVDDLYPMRIQHSPFQQTPFVYFDNIDPRFRERYDEAYRKAAAANATPEQMKNFLVEFARKDPDRKAQGIFLKLISAMRAQNTFEGYYHTYLLLQDPTDARNASRLARTDEHKAMMENIAVATLVDKNRLLNFDFRLTPTTTTSSEGGCWMFCRYNFSASRHLLGQISVRQQATTPIKLTQGTYKVTLNAEVSMSRRKVRESNWLGNYDGPDDVAYTRDIVLTLAPPTYSIAQAVNLGELTVAFFQRGSAGGYEGSWATGDASIKILLKSVELIK